LRFHLNGFEPPAWVWRAMIASHYPRGGWIRLGEDTIQQLGRYKAATGTPTLDRCISDLLDAAPGRGEAG
jgi:hypothetical protein